MVSRVTSLFALTNFEVKYLPQHIGNQNKCCGGIIKVQGKNTSPTTKILFSNSNFLNYLPCEQSVSPTANERETRHWEQPSAFPSSMCDFVTPDVTHLMSISFVNRPFPHSSTQQRQVEARVDKNTVNVWKCPFQLLSGAIVRTHWVRMSKRSIYYSREVFRL